MTVFLLFSGLSSAGLRMGMSPSVELETVSSTNGQLKRRVFKPIIYFPIYSTADEKSVKYQSPARVDIWKVWELRRSLIIAIFLLNFSISFSMFKNFNLVGVLFERRQTEKAKQLIVTNYNVCTSPCQACPPPSSSTSNSEFWFTSSSSAFSWWINRY